MGYRIIETNKGIIITSYLMSCNFGLRFVINEQKIYKIDIHNSSYSLPVILNSNKPFKSNYYNYLWIQQFVWFYNNYQTILAKKTKHFDTIWLMIQQVKFTLIYVI